MTFDLWPWQERALRYVREWYAASAPGARLLVSAPTGTGKGTLALAVQEALGGAILTPSREIIRGFRERVPGAWVDTPVAHRNALLRGDTPPGLYLLDEGHHHIDDNVVTGELYAINPDARWIGLTATPYRGTPRGTERLRRAWGEPYVAYDIPAAVADGTMAIPEVRIVPLWDDDTLRVINGEFVIRSASRACESHIDAIADYARSLEGPRVVSVPGREAAVSLSRVLGCPYVVASTSADDRTAAYEQARAGGVFVQINVVSEGWDAPWLVHYVDAHPTMSPVRWMQVIGRLCRRGTHSTYHCLCRNLERHAYLLGGYVPPSKVAESQKAYGGPLTQSMSTRVGLESVGRLKALPVPLADGTLGSMYCVYAVHETTVSEYVVILLPGAPEPLVATRVNKRGPKAPGEWAHWERCELPSDFTGYATSEFRHEPTEKQRHWWQRAARRFGLDPEAEITAREFQVLPVLTDLEVKVCDTAR